MLTGFGRIVEKNRADGYVFVSYASNIRGISMKKWLLAAVLLVATMQQPLWAQRSCYSAGAIEADQAIRYLTNLMVVSTACQDTAYAEFRLRNQKEIIGYQKAMIAYFRSTAAFDRWNTSLANQVQIQYGKTSTATVCQQGAELMQQARALAPQQFRAMVIAQAAKAGPQYARCKR
jgi:hypothetical protein